MLHIERMMGGITLSARSRYELCLVVVEKRPGFTSTRRNIAVLVTVVSLSCSKDSATHGPASRFLDLTPVAPCDRFKLLQGFPFSTDGDVRSRREPHSDVQSIFGA